MLNYEGSRFSWYLDLHRNGRRTFWACFLGYALDAMDVQIYSFVLPVLIGVWGISKTDAGLLASTTLVFSAIGGWAAGLFIFLPYWVRYKKSAEKLRSHSRLMTNTIVYYRRVL